MTTETDVADDGVSLNVVALAAGLAIKAGLTMTSEDDMLRLPQRGWAPPPATGAMSVEYACALAVQALINAFDLDPVQVDLVAATLIILATSEDGTEAENV